MLIHFSAVSGVELGIFWESGDEQYSWHAASLPAPNKDPLATPLRLYVYTLCFFMCFTNTSWEKILSHSDFGRKSFGAYGTTAQKEWKRKREKLNAKVICWCQDFIHFSVAFFFSPLFQSCCCLCNSQKRGINGCKIGLVFRCRVQGMEIVINSCCWIFWPNFRDVEQLLMILIIIMNSCDAFVMTFTWKWALKVFKEWTVNNFCYLSLSF